MIGTPSAGAALSVAIPYASAPDAFAMWQVISGGEPANFAASAAPVVVWQAEFRNDAASAEAFLLQRAQGLEAFRASLPEANRRQQMFIRSVHPGAVAMNSLDEVVDSASPERVLTAWLLTMQDSAASLSGESFAARWSEWAEEAQAFLEQVRRTLAYAAFVDLKVRDQLMARTVISWLGAARTISANGLSPEWAGVHRRLVSLAIESRAAWLQLAAHVLGSALLLGVLLPSGNAVLAIPAAWRFIRVFLADVRRLRMSYQSFVAI